MKAWDEDYSAALAMFSHEAPALSAQDMTNFVVCALILGPSWNPCIKKN